MTSASNKSKKTNARSNPAKKKLPARGMIDYPLLIVTLIMLAFGTIMVTSASAPTALNSSATDHDVYFYLKKQLMILPIGLVGMVFCAAIDVRFYKKFANAFYVVAIVLRIAAIMLSKGVVTLDIEKEIEVMRSDRVF